MKKLSVISCIVATIFLGMVGCEQTKRVTITVTLQSVVIKSDTEGEIGQFHFFFCVDGNSVRCPRNGHYTLGNWYTQIINEPLTVSKTLAKYRFDTEWHQGNLVVKIVGEKDLHWGVEDVGTISKSYAAPTYGEGSHSEETVYYIANWEITLE